MSQHERYATSEGSETHCRHIAHGRHEENQSGVPDNIKGKGRKGWEHHGALEQEEGVANVSSAPRTQPNARETAQKLRVGRGLLSGTPPSFASNHHVTAILADLRRGGQPREHALALLSGIVNKQGNGDDRSATSGADALDKFGRGLVDLLLDSQIQPDTRSLLNRFDSFAGDRERSNRMKAMETLVEWLRCCPPSKRAAEGIMDGMCAAMVSMVLGDYLARQRDEEGEPPPLLNIPQRFWLRERDLRTLRDRLGHKNKPERAVDSPHCDRKAPGLSWAWQPHSGQDRADVDAVGKDAERMVTAESEAAGWEADEGSGAGSGEDESEWEVVEDCRQGEGSRVQDLTSSRAWRQFLQRRDGHLLDDEALVIVDLVREACKHHTCAAPARDERYQDGALQQAHDDGMGLVFSRSGMCWHARDRDGEDRGDRQRGGARGPSCRVADHVRQLEALTVCLERLCGHPTRHVALAAVSCVRAFACIPLLLASEQCPRLARACLPLLAPHSLPHSLSHSLTHVELGRCPSELGLVAACADAPLGDRMRAISAISACILRDQVKSTAMLRSCRASSACPTLSPPALYSLHSFQRTMFPRCPC